MKKLMISAVLSILILFGCSRNITLVEDNSAPKSDGEIVISGNFYERTFEEFMEETSNPDIKHYHIRINSDGGDAHACTGIINRIIELKKKGVKFTTETYTKAYSAGSFIFMMGDERIMHQGSFLMWHTVIGQADHDGRSMRDDRKPLIYMLDRNIIRQAKKAIPYVSDELWDHLLWDTGMTWMGAEEALHHGIATILVEN